jgi:hypothetical protein
VYVFLQTWQLRDLLTIKHTPSCITVIAESDGAILWQNASSMATFGEEGLQDLRASGPDCEATVRKTVASFLTLTVFQGPMEDSTPIIVMERGCLPP